MGFEPTTIELADWSPNQFCHLGLWENRVEINIYVCLSTAHILIQKLHFFFSSSECSSYGGTSDRSCANGYGVCCICKLLFFPFVCFATLRIVVSGKLNPNNFSHHKLRCTIQPKLHLLWVEWRHIWKLQSHHLPMQYNNLPVEAWLYHTCHHRTKHGK